MFKRTVVLAVILAAAFLVVPLASDAESATPEDIVITLPGSASGDHLSMEIGSGGSDSFIIYVYNTSDCYLSLTVDAEGSSDSVDVTATSNKDMLMPDRLTESGQVAMVDVTVSIDRYDDSPTETATVNLTFTDLEDGLEPFTLTVTADISVTSAFYSADGDNKFLGMFPNTLDGFLGSEWVTALVTLVAWVLIAYAVCLVFIPLFARIFTGKGSEDERKKVRRNLTSLVVALIAVLASSARCSAEWSAAPTLASTHPSSRCSR